VADVVTSDEVRVAVVRDLFGRGLLGDDDYEPRRLTVREAVDVVLPSLGGTWDVVHTHVFTPNQGPRAEHAVNCQDPCPFKSGRHEVRRRWTSDPVTT
jgi:hypothetical protein